jgi:hypothetical protein
MAQFHMDVMGPQVPEQIANKIFELFSSEDQLEDAMNFEVRN